MGRKWSNFKVDLKLEHYEPNRGNVTAIMNEHRPDCVPKDQWISLVTYWISDKGKVNATILLILWQHTTIMNDLKLGIVF